MIVQEQISDMLIRTYSDRGVMIHGGSPQANYVKVIDPINAGRTYTETNIPIPAPDVPQELESCADYLLAEGYVQMPEITEPDYFNEREPEPDYFA